MYKRGISTIELLIAIAILTMALTATAYVTISAPAIIADARHAEEALENARQKLQMESGIGEVPLEDEEFSLQTSQMSWATAYGKTRPTELSTIVRNNFAREVCDPFTSGNWSKPQLKQSYVLGSSALASSFSGTFDISAIAIMPNMLAISVASTSQASAPDIFFFSLIGTSSPRLVAAFDTASTSRIGNNAVAITDGYAFVGNAFSSKSTDTCSDGISCAQISVYEMRAGSATFLSSLSLDISSEPFAQAVSGGNAVVSSLTYNNGFLYIGLQKTTRGDEFDIVDARNPAHLQWLSGYPIGRTVNDISVRDGLAYVSTDDPSRELMIFGLNDPTHPILNSSWDASGPSTFGYGSASTIYGNHIRFGRTYASSNPEFELLTRSGSGVITEIESIDLGTAKDPESVRALLTQDRLTFALLTHRVVVIDTHDYNQASVIGTYDFPPDMNGVALACRNNQIYVAENDTDGNGHIDILQGA